jgi:hypothetical protein
MMRKQWMFGAAMLVALGTGQARADLLVGYATGPGQPWGLNDNINAMNTVFGAGNWNPFDISTPAGATALDAALTSGQYKMIYINGGAATSDTFNSFVSTYTNDLQSFVANGGALILDAARWPDGTAGFPDQSLGFGGVSLHNNNYDLASYTGTAVNASNPLFQNLGFGNPATSWTGNYFSHDAVQGPFGTSLIVGSGGQTVLAEENYGKGFVMFGGLTDPSFQSSGGVALLDNMLYIAGNFSPNAVPEPSSLVMMISMSVMGFGAYSLRRRRAAA